MDDKFQALLNDPEKMKAAFEAASQFLGKTGTPTMEAPAETPAPSASQPSTTDLAAMLQNMKESGALDNLMSAMSQGGGAPGEGETTSASGGGAPAAAAAGIGGAGIAGMLPQLMQMMGGGGGAINPQRANLIKALKPYMNESRAGNVDRAVNMANMAKNAKSVLGGFKK